MKALFGLILPFLLGINLVLSAPLPTDPAELERLAQEGARVIEHAHPPPAAPPARVRQVQQPPQRVRDRGFNQRHEAPGEDPSPMPRNRRVQAPDWEEQSDYWFFS